MIHHLSIAAREPERVAGMLAELMSGVAVPDGGNFFAWQLDEHCSGLEVYPAGMELRPGGATGGSFVKSETGRGFGPTHDALTVAADADTVERAARREGWQCFRCNRGPFDMIEVWVENETLVEILPPEYAKCLFFTRSQGLNLAKSKSRPSSSVLDRYDWSI